MDFVVAGAIGVVILLLVFGRGLGRLPGDVTLRRGGVRVYAPLATSCLVSVVLSVLLTALFGWCTGAVLR